MKSAEILLHTNDLSVGYEKRTIISDITFSLKEGEILVLIGPNGAGKTTILRTISSQLQAIAGTVFLEKQDLKLWKESDLAKKMSLMLTEKPGAERMTVWDVISSGRYPYTGFLGILDRDDKIAVNQAISMTGLENEINSQFNSLSDGQKQRAMLARAICQEPEVLILDEPTSFLDIRNKLELLAILKDLAKEKKVAIVMSLHELDLAQKCADSLLCVSEGTIDRYGTPAQIFSDSSYIQRLYNVEKGSFISEFGSLELEKPGGEPEVFVIGGGGSGLEVYRSLARQGIPFACGVLHTNDLEYPVAKALAAQVIAEKAFEPVSPHAEQAAAALIQKCRGVICTLTAFGTVNAANRNLLEYALNEKKLIDAPAEVRTFEDAASEVISKEQTIG